MPIAKTTLTEGGQAYATAGLFVGPVDHTETITVDVSSLTNAEVDAKGFIKPGTPLTAAGALLDEDDAVYGVVIEPVKVHTSNSGLSSVTDDVPVTLAKIGQLNRDLAEDNLGRAFSADELAGFAASGIVLTQT